MNKINSYIGFAIKSGNATFGLDNCLKNKNIVLAICISSLSDGSKAKLKKAINNVIELSSNQIKNMSVSFQVLGISEPSLAKQIEKETKHLGEENFDNK